MAERHDRNTNRPAKRHMWVLDTDFDPVKKIDGRATRDQLIAHMARYRRL
jgi:hypothetical protein